MKLLFVCAVMSLLSVSAFASPRANLYDAVYSDCVDYGHSQVPAEKIASCQMRAENEVLSSSVQRSDYLDCVDYYHSSVSAEKHVNCLRYISEFSN